MTRLTGRWWLAIASLAIVVGMAQVVLAQREGRGRGFGPRGGGMVVSPVGLASLDVVQDELQLTDEQKQKIDAINEEMREELRSLRDRESRDRREARERLSRESVAKLNDVLDDGQQKRLAGIMLQVDLAAGLEQEIVVEELELTDEQKTKLGEARDANRRAMREAMGDVRDASREERRTKMTEVREVAEKNLMDVLTSEQQAKVKELKGDAIEMPRRDRDRQDRRGRRGGTNN